MDNRDLQSRIKEIISHVASSSASLFQYFLIGSLVTFLLLIIAIQFGWSTIAGLIFGVAAIAATLFCALLNTIRSTFGKGRSVFLGIIVLYLNLMSALAFSAPDFFSGLSLDKWMALSMIFFAATSGGSLALVSYERASRIVSILIIIVNAMVFVKAENRPQDAIVAKIEKQDEDNRNKRIADSLKIVLKKINEGTLVSELTPHEREIYRKGAANRDENGLFQRVASMMPRTKKVYVTIRSLSDIDITDELSPDLWWKLEEPKGRIILRLSSRGYTTNTMINAMLRLNGKNYGERVKSDRLILSFVFDNEGENIEVVKPKSVLLVFSGSPI